MGHRLSIAAAAVLAALTAAPPATAQPRRANAWYTQGDFHPAQRLELQIRNDLAAPRRNNPVVIRRDQLSVLPDVHDLEITLVDPARPSRPAPSPALLSRQGAHETRGETNGAWVPYQLDDLDRDGLWDELFFMTDIGANENKIFYLYLGFQQRGWHPHRTHAAIGSYMRHLVPFWESEHVGWKLWFPTDIDVFGKRAPVLMSQHLYMENLDGYGVSQTDPAWGSDMMQVDTSFGGGGVGLFEDAAHPDVVSRARFTPQGDPDSVDAGFNARPRGDNHNAFDELVNGPMRSMVRARTMNWNSGRGRYEVEQVYTAYAGESYATARVRFTTFEPQNLATAFAVGIRRHAGENEVYQQGGVVISGAPEAIRNPDDEESFQNSLTVAFAGTALVVRDAYAPAYVFVPAYNGNHAFRITPNAERAFEYLIAAGWSEGAVNRTAPEFQEYVLRTAREYNSPIALARARLETR